MRYLALPYFDAVQRKTYKNILTLPFNINMLFDVDGEEHVLFDGWDGMKMTGDWYKIRNDDDKSNIEFYQTHFFVGNEKSTLNNYGIRFTFPFPITIDYFLAVCESADVKLYWNENAIEKYSPIVLLTQEDLKSYYKNILEIIGKA